MHALDGPVVKTRDAQGAPIADSLAQHFPGVTQVIAIVPSHSSNVAEVLWLGLPQAEWHRCLKLRSPVFFKLMRSHSIGLTRDAGSVLSVPGQRALHPRVAQRLAPTNIPSRYRACLGLAKTHGPAGAPNRAPG